MSRVKLGKNYFKELKALTKNSVNDYTGVYVAAIIVTDKGAFKGVNYEDIIGSLSICAERNAIYNAITNGMETIYEIHLLPSLKGLSMCGACRQLASSFSDGSAVVYNYDVETGKRTKETLGQLLPREPFRPAKSRK